MMSPISAALMSTGMMVAMMLPSFAPTLLRYHRELGGMRASLVGGRTLLFAVGYAAVWIVISVLLLALNGVTLHTSAGWPGALVVLAAGIVQLSPWKACRLRACRRGCVGSSHSVTAGLVEGCRLGVSCGSSCAPAMAVLLVAGLMNPTAMAVMALAITAERIAPARLGVSRLTGGLAVMAGVAMCARLIELPV